MSSQALRTDAWVPRSVHEAALIDVEGRLAGDASAIEPRFDRARLLTELGRTDEARQAYLDLLALSPAHFGALNNLGALLLASGYTTAARSCYAEAVRNHPHNPAGHVNLGNVLLTDDELDSAREHFEVALKVDPDHREAHQGLAGVLQALGEDEAAESHRRLGFRDRAVVTLPYRGAGPSVRESASSASDSAPRVALGLAATGGTGGTGETGSDRIRPERGGPVPLLLLVSAMGGNLRTEQFALVQRYLTTAVVAEYFAPNQPLPLHRAIVNAIGDADLCGRALDAAARLISKSLAPVINAPKRVRDTGRVANAIRLGTIPDVVAPRMSELPRAKLDEPGAFASCARDFGVPFLLRMPGLHNGRHFFRIARGAELVAALPSLRGTSVMAIQYLDARGADGKFRKYRAIFVDGEIYPLHAAISRDWKIHYGTADMAENAQHREEDRAFLEDMKGTIGARAMAALGHIRDTLGLDYAGVDFGLDGEGRLLLFEANATMAIADPGPDERWDYRRAPTTRILDAIAAMIASRTVAEPSTE